jgi:pilus assembly protein CpaE
MDGLAASAGEPALTAAGATALVFVQEAESERVIRQCLSDLKVSAAEFKTGNVNTAITALATRPSPRLLIVDLEGIDDPTGRIRALADVCDPSTGVMVIGKEADIPLYRGLKSAGVAEYYFKPLVRTLVMQTCNSIFTGSSEQVGARTGKLVLFVSVRGGSGGTTMAVATSWFLAERLNRRVTLLDMDLQFGDAALQLGLEPSHALQEALEHPDRVDDLFLDRAVARVDERLGVLASLASLDDPAAPEELATLSLLERLLRGNRYVLVDIPMRVAPRMMHLLNLPATVLLVSSGSLVSARDTGRLREKIGPNTAERVTIHILNKVDASESLSIEEFARAAGARPDIVIPYAKEIAAASRLGAQGLKKSAALQRGLMPVYRQLAGEDLAVTKTSWLRRVFGVAG